MQFWRCLFSSFVMLQCLGYLCCFQAAILSLIQKCTTGQYEPVAEDPSMNLQERQTSLPNSPEHKANQTTHNYKPIINYPVVPSTSRQDASNYLDDVQPCSSKSSDPYRVAWYTLLWNAFDFILNLQDVMCATPDMCVKKLRFCDLYVLYVFSTAERNCVFQG